MTPEEVEQALAARGISERINGSEKQQRAVLWLRRSTCYWCRQETVWFAEDGSPPPNAVRTLLKYPKGDPRYDARRREVACLECAVLREELLRAEAAQRKLASHLQNQTARLSRLQAQWEERRRLHKGQ